MNALVEIANSRSQPSSCEDDVRSLTGHQLELGHAGGAMAIAGAHAVAAGVAAADDDDMLALSAQLVLELVAGIDFVLLR